MPDEDGADGPISGRIRRARQALSRRRKAKQAKKRNKQRKRRIRREAVEQRAEPFTQELRDSREQLSKLRDDIAGEESDGDDEDGEQKQEAAGGVVSSVLGAVTQRQDVDGDGDDDLVSFFGVDDDQGELDPYAAFDDPAAQPQADTQQQQREPEDDQEFTQQEADVFEPVAAFEDQFNPAPNPFEEDDSR